jgi:branched-chain amino acid transport system ATP-binding protein
VKDAILELSDLQVRYGGVFAVDGMSLTIRAGETVVLVGANGAGKTSVINTVMGLVQPAGGRVLYGGTDITGATAARRARAGIRLSPEGRRVFSRLSVYDNVASGAFALPRRERAAAIAWVFSSFGLLAERRNQAAGTLSGGQQQIVALARALVTRPQLLLLDEPFLGLSPIAIAETSAAIRVAQGEGMAVLLSEQMAKPALELAHRGYVMRGGRVTRSGGVAEIADAALAQEYL